jgi:TetR/AcrR family transcriptional regulator, transcriptional repressor of aconitase
VPKVTEQYRVAKREEIAQAALRCFANKGFQRTSMADIIEESGLSAGAIYGHYASKQQIVLEVARKVLGNRSAELYTASEAEVLPAPGDVLAMMMHGFTTDSLRTGLLLQLWGEALVDENLGPVVLDSLFTMLQDAFSTYLTAWARKNRGLDAAGAKDFVEHILPVLLGLGQGYIVQSALLPQFDASGYLATARELLPH